MPKATINSGEVEYVANLTTPTGGKDVALTREKVVEYQRDPDAFAAKHFGLPLNEYREWLETSGAALCGAITKAGKPCSNMISRTQLDPLAWKALHRSGCCRAHGGE